MHRHHRLALLRCRRPRWLSGAGEPRGTRNCMESWGRPWYGSTLQYAAFNQPQARLQCASGALAERRQFVQPCWRREAAEIGRPESRNTYNGRVHRRKVLLQLSWLSHRFQGAPLWEKAGCHSSQNLMPHPCDLSHEKSFRSRKSKRCVKGPGRSGSTLCISRSDAHPLPTPLASRARSCPVARPGRTLLDMTIDIGLRQEKHSQAP